MRYTIGARVIENDGTISDGIYGYGHYALPCIITDTEVKPNTYAIPIFTDIAEAEDYVKSLCRNCRKEFHSRAHRHDLDISQFRFFLLKVDSLKFKRKLSGISTYQGTSKYSSRKLYWIE